MALNKIALITGGSSGIGFAISRYFAKEGYELLWVSNVEEEINVSKLKMKQEIPDCNVNTLVQDLSLPDGAHNVQKWVLENNWTVNVLINNAGFGTYGFIHETDFDRELNMISLNVTNLYSMTRLFLKDMITRNDGTIINISSNTSFQPTPKLSTYSATKSFVSNFSRSINEELKILKSNVNVICVCPAAIKDTNFKKSGKMEHVKTFSGMAATTTEEVAKDVWKGFLARKEFVISGWRMRLLYSISVLVPYKLKQVLIRKEIKETK